MTHLNLWSAWVGVLAGMASGAVMGLAFHDERWLGGYGSWPRRMLRLGHISFFGIAFLNFAYAGTVAIAGAGPYDRWVSPLLVAGAVLMPAICILAAWRKPMRHLFPLPVLSLGGAVSLIVLGGL
jgi:hypothetical protein